MQRDHRPCLDPDLVLGGLIMAFENLIVAISGISLGQQRVNAAKDAIRRLCDNEKQVWELLDNMGAEN